MILDHKTYELFGKPILQRLKIKAPFTFDFPITEHACFLYMIDGDIEYKYNGREAILPQKHSLFLNCIHSCKTISSLQPGETKEIMVINFHPDILKQIYAREVPVLLQNLNVPISNQSIEHIDSDILIEKYVDGLLFYFQHPALVNDDILILKLKEIILLLSQSFNAPAMQTIFNQLFSPVTYTFKKIVEANIFTQLNIDALAAQHNLSISSFKREFFKNYNDTPANYIKNKRVQKAAELLIISSQRIKEIAFQCGFNDIANFNKSFKEKYYISPSVYRKAQK